MSDMFWVNDFSKKYDKQQRELAIEQAKEFTERPTNTREELDNLIVELMCTYGPDGHCDGHELITEVIWQKMNQGRKIKNDCIFPNCTQTAEFNCSCDFTRSLWCKEHLQNHLKIIMPSKK